MQDRTEFISGIKDRAARLLARWAAAAEQYWNQAEDDPSMGCYGPGYRTWGVQSNWNYAGVMATLASRADSAEQARRQDRAVSALRFLLKTHVTGGRLGNDGKPWGHSRISMLGIERAMHGLMPISGALLPADQAALRRVLTNEADWLLMNGPRRKSAAVVAGLWDKDGSNFPESNIWSGCFLWRVAGLYPDEFPATAWKERAHRYLMNGVSVEADARDATVVAGRPVSEWHAGANFFPHYGLDHHGYLNVGYMAICASNTAILHFDLKRAGLQPPASLYHHQDKLWQVLRRMIFGDGRLAQIGGDVRLRYAYCQEYLLPVLLFAADHLRDPHALSLAGRQLDLIEREAEASGDGLFYGRRLAHLRHGNPHYYTRLESDRACVLAMLLNYLPLVNAPPSSSVSFDESAAGEWMEPSHGAVMHRSARRLSSFVWRAYGLAQALCLPPRDASLAEWLSNLCPLVRFLGDDGSHPEQHRRLLAHYVRSFQGGFVTCGSVMEGVDVAIDEGASCTDQAVTQVAFAALPDDRTCLCLQYVAATPGRVGLIAEIKDLHLAVPNDLFNGYRRALWSASGQTALTSPPERSEALALQGGWLNMDDCLGVVVLYGGEELLIDRSVSRRGGRYQSFFVEDVCLHARSGAAVCRGGDILVDAGFAILADSPAEDTRRARGGAIPFARKDLKGAWIIGSNGRRYALAANFGGAAQAAEIFGKSIELAPGTATVQEVP